jgi:hypothetical protein
VRVARGAPGAYALRCTDAPPEALLELLDARGLPRPGGDYS